MVMEDNAGSFPNKNVAHGSSNEADADVTSKKDENINALIDFDNEATEVASAFVDPPEPPLPSVSNSISTC